MSATDTPHSTPLDVELIEAFANGELDYDTHDTEDFLRKPFVGAVLRTPNGSKIRITHKDGWISRKGEDILIVHAKVLEAPRCPQYLGHNVKIAIDLDGTIHVLTEIRV